MDESLNVTLSKDGISEFLTEMLKELSIDEIDPHVTLLAEGQIHFVLGDLKLLIEVTDLDQLLN